MSKSKVNEAGNYTKPGMRKKKLLNKVNNMHNMVYIKVKKDNNGY